MEDLQLLATSIIDIFLHLDQHLVAWAQWMGPWLYLLLFAVVFAETGLVVTPFLPGDSLLFAVGALTAAEGSPIHLGTVIILLVVAGVLGDACNYAIGHYIGPRIFTRDSSIWLNRKHLVRAQSFYDKYGGKAIVFARFVPIVRTFAPFVAGIGKMSYRRFAFFNIAGAIAWVVLFSVAGAMFGNIPVVKKNFQYVIFGIIFVSILPGFIEFARARREARALKGSAIVPQTPDVPDEPAGTS
ncbi:MAG: DedA family protein [Deltaproteobacteria bacterium]|nr:DedA family protein [Deltaproteobacteria bacterium]